MDGPAGISEITLKLTRNGRYTWSITNTFQTKDMQGGVNELFQMDTLLKNKFPNHVTIGTGRAVSLDDD